MSKKRVQTQVMIFQFLVLIFRVHSLALGFSSVPDSSPSTLMVTMHNILCILKFVCACCGCNVRKFELM